MVQGSQNCKSQTTHIQGTRQTPVAKKPPTLNNDVPTLQLLHQTPELLITMLIERTAKGNYKHAREDPCTRG